MSDINLSPVTRVMGMAYKELGVKKRDVNGRSQYGKFQMTHFGIFFE